jgi:formylglycine-generating enzyme required for sulfatase activity
MKMSLFALLFALGLFAGSDRAAAQGARFFRITGPTAATITSFQPDGSIVWGNAQSGGTYSVQTTSSLPGGTNWVDYVQLPASQAVNTNKLMDFNPPAGMAFIPAGVFTMGNYLINGSSITNDPDITDANPVTATVSAFYMDVNLVSYSMWTNVYAYATSHGYSFDDAGAGKAPNNPVYSVNWYDCVKWCNARSQQAGKTPLYYTDAGKTQVYTAGDTDSVYVNWGGQGYRLPTEAEWEKAARGGLVGERFPWGDVISENLANYSGDTTDYSYDLGPNGTNPIGATGGSPYTSPVGSFAPNGYGIFDMAGNLMEWCWDWHGTYAGGNNPQGSSGSSRIFRGGFWGYGPDVCRSAYRDHGAPSNVGSYLGFRSVLPSGQ